MIGIGQAEYLFKFVKQSGYLKIYAELERIGVKNVINLFSDYQKRRIYHYVLSDQPEYALKLLGLFPSKE